MKSIPKELRDLFNSPDLREMLESPEVNALLEEVASHGRTLPPIELGSLQPMECYRMLGVAPWTSQAEIDRHFAERYRRSRREPDFPYSQEDLNRARAHFSEPRLDAERRFWSFPIPLSPEIPPEEAPPPHEAAMRRELEEGMKSWL